MKSKYEKDGENDYTKIVKELELEFNEVLKCYRHGEFKEINDQFYENMEQGINISRFKLCIFLYTHLVKFSKILKVLEY